MAPAASYTTTILKLSPQKPANYLHIYFPKPQQSSPETLPHSVRWPLNQPIIDMLHLLSTNATIRVKPIEHGMVGCWRRRAKHSLSLMLHLNPIDTNEGNHPAVDLPIPDEGADKLNANVVVATHNQKQEG